MKYIHIRIKCINQTMEIKSVHFEGIYKTLGCNQNLGMKLSLHLPFFLVPPSFSMVARVGFRLRALRASPRLTASMVLVPTKSYTSNTKLAPGTQKTHILALQVYKGQQAFPNSMKHFPTSRKNHVVNVSLDFKILEC